MRVCLLNRKIKQRPAGNYVLCMESSFWGTRGNSIPAVLMGSLESRDNKYELLNNWAR